VSLVRYLFEELCKGSLEPDKVTQSYEFKLKKRKRENMDDPGTVLNVMLSQVCGLIIQLYPRKLCCLPLVGNCMIDRLNEYLIRHQVPGMGADKAVALRETFPSMKALIAASQSDLAEVKCGGRRLGPKAASRLHAILHLGE
jgi:hypothetical protein